MPRRVFDGFLFNGEIDLLEIRLHALDAVVDAFVLIEGTRRFDGAPKPLFFRQHWERLRPFWPKLRCVIVDDWPAQAGAQEREQHQRGAVSRALLDAADADLVLLSDIGEIPHADAVRRMRQDAAGEAFGLRLDVQHSVPNHAAAAGPGPAIRAVACRRDLLREWPPDRMREGIRDGSMPATILDQAGWHVSALADAASRRHRRDIARAIGARKPTASRLREGFSGILRRRPAGPVIICPYVHDADVARVRAAFRLDEAAGRHLPFFLWQDQQLIGPERAFEACWKQFPGRDVIIIHPDMQPLPEDRTNAWFSALLDHVARLPDAGIVACDLLHPDPMPDGGRRVQSAGGLLDGGRIGRIFGMAHGASFQAVREATWVTFGGVYIRREAIDLCGSFDPRYRWAYVMDVDYSLEIRRRGYRLYQVPVNLLHEENGTTREFLARPEYRDKVAANHTAFTAKWGLPLAVGDYSCAALPALAPEETARFQPGGAWNALLGAGWSLPEAWGVWSEASQAFLRIALPRSWEGPARLGFDVWCFVSPQQPEQRVAIRGRTGEFGEWRLGADPTYIEVTIPAAAIQGDQVILTLSLPDAVSPSEAGLSSDARRLGLGLLGLTLRAPP